ncbi:hypothetical protein RFM68_11900 [Mesorhizobium sp. MSK_1335]|uniref:Uncharacterized protein n=1 Tax=Mesorhizobium montanum TaxID=3072323 RepID=A0ABU4ZIQ0_9HYPH|nr:hypothetical protein [Mesorhizobium sp. MSK_1335]MDX8525215.1 hypothetical protein [Mesorhizobium sp. MSK_1335]
MSILSSIGRIATEYAATRARYRAERTLYLLPLDIRKDIGWPELGGRGGPEVVSSSRLRVVIAR